MSKENKVYVIFRANYAQNKISESVKILSQSGMKIFSYSPQLCNIDEHKTTKELWGITATVKTTNELESNPLLPGHGATWSRSYKNILY